MKPIRRQITAQERAIHDTAGNWLADRDLGFSAEAAAEFARWRQADPRHEAAVVRLEATWNALAQLQSFRPEAQRHPDGNLLARPAGRRLAYFPGWATAAALAASLALAAVWWWSPSFRSQTPVAVDQSDPTVLATTYDGYHRAMLTDGSVVELNSNTEVRVHLTPGERRLKLVRGEAHFTVAKDPARPFFVEVGRVAVRAVGTAFDVRMRPESIEVLVTEGVVKVSDTAPLAEHATASTPTENELPTLVAGQRGIIMFKDRTAYAMVETTSPVVIREALAWHGSRLIFADLPLAEVITQFNRRNQVQLLLEDPELGAQSVGGSFRADNVEAFVRLLADNKEILIERPDDNHVIIRKAR